MNELAQAQVAPPAQPPAAPQAAGQELAPQQEQAPQLPQPLDAVASGQVPATVLPPVQPNVPPDPVQEFVISNFEQLPQVGLDVVEAPDMSTIVFNPQLIDRASVEKAAQEGTIDQLMAPAQGQELAGGGAEPAAQAAPTPAVDDTAVKIAQQHSGQRADTNVSTPKVPASTQNLLAKARVRNMGAGAKQGGLVPNPTSNQLSKRPV